ncbi:hypothetical protein [Streptomyces sp. NPDC051211]|uniref:hypothetical protein n=1 Tax=Streptomyces sp. NPDC051211 TaxID=3154643 RepID=UPI00344FEF67
MSQHQPPQHNPYTQPAVSQQPLGYGAPPPMPGQAPVQPGWPMQPPGHPYPHPAPPGRRPNTGHPVGAFFLGLLASVIVAMLYSGIILATYEDQTEHQAHTLYVLHALLNGVAVGALVGLVGRRSNGARIGAAVVAPLGAFFGYTNAIPLVIAARETPAAVGDMMEIDPFFPAKAWWGSQSDTEWLSLSGLVVAAAAAWGLAYAIGRRRA